MAASNGRRASVITYGPNPLTVAMVGALDAARGLAAAGRLGMVRQGVAGTGSRKFAGDLGPQQQFRGYAGPMSGQQNRRGGGILSLPFTNGAK